jgi:hypothetical protein
MTGSEHAPWCADHGDSGCRSENLDAGDVRVRLVQSHGGNQLVVLHADAGYPYPILLLPVDEAAEFAALMRALGHEDIAAAADQVLSGCGAVLAEKYGRQYWKMP